MLFVPAEETADHTRSILKHKSREEGRGGGKGCRGICGGGGVEGARDKGGGGGGENCYS